MVQFLGLTYWPGTKFEPEFPGEAFANFAPLDALSAAFETHFLSNRCQVSKWKESAFLEAQQQLGPDSASDWCVF